MHCPICGYWSSVMCNCNKNKIKMYNEYESTATPFINQNELDAARIIETKNITGNEIYKIKDMTKIQRAINETKIRLDDIRLEIMLLERERKVLLEQIQNLEAIDELHKED